MASSVTEAQSYDTCTGGRSVAGVHRSVTGKRTEVYWDGGGGGHGNATRRHRSVMGAWLHGLIQCIFGHWKVTTKLMIIPFVTREWVMYG